MVQTRSQRAAKRGRSLGDQDQDAPTRKRQCQTLSHKSPNVPLKRRGRRRTVEDSGDLGSKPSSKRRQTSRPPVSPVPETLENTAADDADPNNPIDFWIKRNRWPSPLFEPVMDHLLARKRSLSVLSGRKRANSSSSITPSDQKPREEKSTQYRDPRYKLLLETKGSFMDTSDLGIEETSKKIWFDLLSRKQETPKESLFRDDLFERTCRSVQDRNEARVLRDITLLIVPSAEILTIYGNTSLRCLIESTNEGWNNSIPMTGTRPQPDYSVGFRREAFTDSQLAKLSPFVGDFIAGDLSFFMATYYMYFPFFSCEVKCGTAALDVADRQNAHSMTLAARGIVELFRLVKRENEVHRQILSFSVSHDHRLVRIYGYYPVINGEETKYYRHPIHTFDFTALNGKDKWTAHQFTKNLYNNWMPGHFERICSAIDQLPLEDFRVLAPSQSTSLSQGLENLAQLEGSALLPTDGGNRSSQMDTLAASFSKPAPAKKRKSPVKKS
ncbi:hypothetical protein F4802DRAFT_615761 [Xylaria palmicola]|nr:hypothetical protein F4802DRAFT_615761 [Xylaria palmicola]